MHMRHLMECMMSMVKTIFNETRAIEEGIPKAECKVQIGDLTIGY